MESSSRAVLFEERYGLPKKTIESIRPYCVAETIKRGDSALKVGDLADDFVFLLNGAMKQIRYTDDGTEIVNALYFRPGDCLLPIEHDLFRPAFSKTEMVALRESVIVKIGCSVVTEMMQALPGFNEQVVSVLNSVRQWYCFFQFNLSAYKSNLKGLLLQLIKSDPYIMANASLEDLASFIGVSYYHLSRVRKEIIREHPELVDYLAAYKN